MSFGGTSRNVFGVKTVTGGTSTSLTGATEAAISNLTGLTQFVSLTSFLPESTKGLVSLAHDSFLTPFDNRRFNRIGTNLQRQEVVDGLSTYRDSITDDPSLTTFLNCVIKGTNAAYNMKDLESTFLQFKQDATLEINDLKKQINLLLDGLIVRDGDAVGFGSSRFEFELTDFYTLFIYIYGYHPDDPDWVTDPRTIIVTDLLERIRSGEITIDDVLPELYINT